jgi:hypothetical protein
VNEAKPASANTLFNHVSIVWDDSRMTVRDFLHRTFRVCVIAYFGGLTLLGIAYVGWWIFFFTPLGYWIMGCSPASPCAVP